MKTYTEEEVKKILGNGIQHVSNSLYDKRDELTSQAKNYALKFVDSGSNDDKFDAQKLMYADRTLEGIIKNIKDQQYHLFIDKLLISNKL